MKSIIIYFNYLNKLPGLSIIIFPFYTYNAGSASVSEFSPLIV